MRAWLRAVAFPSPLRRTDKWFVIRHPQIWTTKFYYVAYYVVVANGVVLAILIPIDVRVSQILTWISVILWVLMFEFLAVLLYIERIGKAYLIDPYGPERRASKGWFALILFIACIGMIATPSVISLLTIRTKLIRQLDEVDIVAAFDGKNIIGIDDADSFDSSDCRESVESTDPNLNIDSQLLELYSGRTVTNPSQAADVYCVAFFNALVAHSLLFEAEGAIPQVLIAFHIVLLGLAWFAWAEFHIPQPVTAYFYMLFMSVVLIVAGSFGLSRLFPAYFSEAVNVVRYVAIISGATLAISAWAILRVRKLRRFSIVRTLLIVGFPVALFFFSFTLFALLSVYLGSFALNVAAAVFVFIPMIPLLRDRLMTMSALPRN